MAPADSDTPEYVSRAIGDFTRKSRSRSWTMGQIGKSNIQEREEGARLLRPEELRGLSTNDCVLLIHESDPVLAQKVRYYEDRFFEPVFKGQDGAYPATGVLELPKRATAPEEMGSVPNEGDVEDDISKEDFKRMKLSQSDLLEKVRSVKKAVSVSLDQPSNQAIPEFGPKFRFRDEFL